MSAAAKKKPVPRGRPPLGRSAIRERDQQLKADGDRLREALKLCDLSQAEAERLTGIRQNYLSEMISGKRAIRRDDLRNLAKAGISADFVLGNATAHQPPNQSRTPAAIEADVSVLLTRELERAFPRAGERLRRPREWFVNGEEALRALVELTKSSAPAALQEMKLMEEHVYQISSISRIASVLFDDIHTRLHGIGREWTFAEEEEFARASELLDIASAVSEMAESPTKRFVQLWRLGSRPFGRVPETSAAQQQIDASPKVLPTKPKPARRK